MYEKWDFFHNPLSFQVLQVALCPIAPAPPVGASLGIRAQYPYVVLSDDGERDRDLFQAVRLVAAPPPLSRISRSSSAGLLPTGRKNPAAMNINICNAMNSTVVNFSHYKCWYSIRSNCKSDRASANITAQIVSGATVP